MFSDPELPHMAKEGGAEKNLRTVCGAPQCQCMRIMANLVNHQTSFFVADSNFTTKTGPEIPAKFVREHGHEMAMQVTLESGAMVSAVAIVIDVQGDAFSVRFGEGWESFMTGSKFHEEDLLFFTLQGQLRFAIMSVRGHSRRKPDADPEQPKEGEVLKPSETLLADVLKLEATARAKRAAKLKLKPGLQAYGFKHPAVRRRHSLPPHLGSGKEAASKEPIPVVLVDLCDTSDDDDSKPANENDGGKQHVTQVSSHDALDAYLQLLESSHSDSDPETEESPDEMGWDSSDFEDEVERKNYSRRGKRRRRGAR